MVHDPCSDVGRDCECLYLDGMELWRVGTKLGRTVYRQHGIDPCGKDTFLGMMETRELAELTCKVMNEWFSQGNTSAGAAGSAR
jgi:hypothetical protein